MPDRSRPRRVVVGVVGDDPEQVAIRISRVRLAEGAEVVYLGEQLSALQVARSAVAEDADEVLVPKAAVDAVAKALADLDAADVEVLSLEL